MPMRDDKMTGERILILGASGMLGSAMVRFLGSSPDFQVFGTVRSKSIVSRFPASLQEFLISGVDVFRLDHLVDVFSMIRPNAVVNCIGVVKQLDSANDPLAVIPINSLFPHQLAKMARLGGARLIHVSTDCVFTGRKGGYTESDAPDADDLYGRSKLLGEVTGPGAVTLRTSIIGHELVTNHSLVDWFLSQKGPIKGYRRAIFSGIPTCELARIVHDYVLPDEGLSGLYHVSAEPINKYTLLRLVADRYKKDIEVLPDDETVIDRSLNSDRFRSVTAYAPPAWESLISHMYEFK